MLKDWFRHKGKPDIVHVDALTFQGEQDGPVEQQLKSELSKVFESRSDVETAYLARVHFKEAQGHNVALCVTGVSYPDRLKVVDKVSKVFAAMFGAQEHLDILFPSEMQQAELGQVCQPFYVRSRIG